jgi:hypothetical protein
MYSTLALKDKVTMGSRTVTIKLNTPLTTSDTRIIIPAEALKDMLGNTSLLIETPIIELDNLGPNLKKVSLAKDNKTITITLNEEVKLTTIGIKKVQLAALKAAISLTSDANNSVPTYNPLTDADLIELKKDQIIIKLAVPLTGGFNRIFIAENIMRDIFGNTNENLTTSLLVADEAAPVFTRVVLPPKKYNLQIVVSLNENVFNALTVEKALLKSALKAAVTISTDGDSESPTFSPLKDKERVSIKSSKNQLVIDLTTKLVTGVTYRVKIDAGTLKDITGNTNAEIITEAFTVDLVGPELGWPIKI